MIRRACTSPINSVESSHKNKQNQKWNIRQNEAGGHSTVYLHRMTQDCKILKLGKAEKLLEENKEA